ncbi:thioredoxin domain-containing protein [bacterium]|nr:thioredoxin domain-containing protein [bacterium]MBQ6436034.1 thioredoxin domain-containing protein [bacterium]
MTAKKKNQTAADTKDTKTKTSTKEETKKNSTLDIVEAAKKELEQLEAAQAHSSSKKTAFPWGVFAGAFVLACVVMFVGSKIGDMITVNRLKKKLPEIITPLGGGMELDSVSTPSKAGSVYGFKIKFKEYADEEFESYITGDGKLFFTSAYQVEQILADAEAMNSSKQVTATCEDLTKSETPVLDVYVSSDCGYCKQAEVQIASAVEQVPALKEKIVLHYAGSVNDDGTIRSFLGSNDAGTENLRQVCLRDEQLDAFWKYVGCMAEGGESDTCLTSSGANKNTLKACMDDKSRGIASITKDINRAGELAISGTPSFFVNDEQSVSDIDFGGRVPDSYKQILCCASSEQPDFCSQTLTQ